MKIKSHKPRNRWYSPTFTITGIDRETLSLLLDFAQDGCKAHKNYDIAKKTLELAEKMDAWINGDEMARAIPLKLDG